MAEDGAHLARGEIEDGAPLGVVDIAPLRALAQNCSSLDAIDGFPCYIVLTGTFSVRAISA